MKLEENKNQILEIINNSGLENLYKNKNDMYIDIIKNNEWIVEYIDMDSLEYEVLLSLLKTSGHILKYIKNQTEELCRTALYKEPWNLKYVINQTDKLCLFAVKQNGKSIEYVKTKQKKFV